MGDNSSVLQPGNQHSLLSKFFGNNRRTSLTLAGAFVCAGVATAGVSAFNTATAPAKPNHVNLNQSFSTSSDASSEPDQTAPATSSPDSSSTNSSQQHVSVTVNGQDIPVPQNGSVSQTFIDDNGQTSVTVSGNGTASNSSSSSLKVNVSSNGSSSTSTQSNVSMWSTGGSTKQ